jgi:pantoate--beta-alanine ligase
VLQDARRRIVAGERDARAICEAVTKTVRLEYFEIVDPLTMQPVDRIDGRVRVAGAMWIGSTRLIDNILV